MRRLPLFFFSAILATLAGVILLDAQGSPPPAPLVMLSRDARRQIPTILQSGQELIALDDVATLFQVEVREDTLAGGVTVRYKGRSVVASIEQPMASVNGRLVSLPAPATRSGRRWLVPVEFLSRALASIYDTKIELRKASRLLIVGELRVPRVVARIEAAGPPTHTVIDISPPAAATVTQDAFRVLVRIDADALDPVLPASGAGLIDQFRNREPPTVGGVHLRGAGAVNASTSSLESGTRVTIDVNPLGTPSPAPAPTPVPAPLPPAPAGDPIPPLGSPRGALETIVIDPGHGGDDNGVTGAGGTLEKTVALDVARRVKTLIETRLGIRVVLTRDDDRRVELDERAAMANNSKADLFISLHANAAVVPAVQGAEVFYLAVDQEVEEARRAADADSVTMPVVGGGTRTLDAIRWDMAQARHIESSSVLAGILEEELRKGVPMGPRPLQRAPLRVLVGANMPAALIELAYLTNPEQEKRAGTSEYQTAVTQAIHETVLRFRAYLETRSR